MSFLMSLLALILPTSAHALVACPVCTLAVGACLEISRKLGVDDSVVGIWTGAFTLIMISWMIEFFKMRKWNFKGRNLLLFVLSYALYIPLYFSGIINYKGHELWGQDAFLIGMIVGTLALWGASKLYEYMKHRNNGHAHFPFEKVVLPIVTLLVLSVLFNNYVCG
jgi:hypothetical protein